jgi:hypothetical protein
LGTLSPAWEAIPARDGPTIITSGLVAWHTAQWVLKTCIPLASIGDRVGVGIASGFPPQAVSRNNKKNKDKNFGFTNLHTCSKVLNWAFIL